MDTITTILGQLPVYLTAALAIIGALTVILSTVGAVLPAGNPVGTWCRQASADLQAFAAWLRKVSQGGSQPPPAALLLFVAVLALPLTACTPREIAKTSADIAVAGCQVAAADLQDEPEWLKLVCQVAGTVDRFLTVRIPRKSAEAQRLMGAP